MPVSGWTQNQEDDVYTQTVAVEGVVADETKQLILVSPTPTKYNLETALNAGVYCAKQGNGTLTFEASEDIPEYAITYNITIQDL